MDQLANRAVGLVDGRVGVGAPRGVGVGNGDLPEPLARDDPGLILVVLPVGIGEQVALVGIAVRPAVDGDRLDVAGRVETARRQGAPKLVANGALERLEGRCGELETADLVLRERREAPACRGSDGASGPSVRPAMRGGLAIAPRRPPGKSSATELK